LTSILATEWNPALRQVRLVRLNTSKVAVCKNTIPIEQRVVCVSLDQINLSCGTGQNGFPNFVRQGQSPNFQQIRTSELADWRKEAGQNLRNQISSQNFRLFFFSFEF